MLMHSNKPTCVSHRPLSLSLSLSHTRSGPSASQSPGKDKLKGEAKSPKEGIATSLETDLPVDSPTQLSSLPDSPCSGSGIDENPIEFSKMSVYSPSQEQFSMPENIATEAQTSTSLPTAPISEVQGAKCFFSEPEYTVSEQSTSYYNSPATTRPLSFSQSSISPTSLVSPSTYPTTFNSTHFPSGTTEAMMTSNMYQSACMSPSYLSPYGTGKQYTWPSAPTNGVSYGAFGVNSHDLVQGSYPTYQTSAAAAAYSQMTMNRGSYPAGYFPSPVPSTTA